MDKFPIRVLSEMTGVAPTTLRAWERRYGLIKPFRTPKGHRLYTNDHVQLVKRVVDLLSENYTISKAINAIHIDEIRQLNQEIKTPQTSTDNKESDNHWETFIDRFLQAIELFDDRKLEAVYNEAISLYPIDIVTINLLRPLLNRLGLRWEERQAGIAEEHFFSAFLRNKIGARMHHASSRSHGSRLLLACLPGEFHELGILLFALSTMSRGYQVLFLGSDLPLTQIKPVTSTTKVDAIILSGSAVSLNPQLISELNQLGLEQSVPVFLGGLISDSVNTEELNNVTVLGNKYSEALGTLENKIPAYQAF